MVRARSAVGGRRSAVGGWRSALADGGKHSPRAAPKRPHRLFVQTLLAIFRTREPPWHLHTHTRARARSRLLPLLRPLYLPHLSYKCTA